MIKREYCTSRVKVNNEINGLLNRLQIESEGTAGVKVSIYSRSRFSYTERN
jgi:hypothetical protein